jgi:hypothetical protein
MSRDPNRIPGILKRIQVVWEKYPDLRLGQMVWNAAHPYDSFNIEDEYLVKRLEEL